jgi:hypothetical protein
LPQRCTSSRMLSLLCTRDMNVSSCFIDMDRVSGRDVSGLAADVVCSRTQQI